MRGTFRAPLQPTAVILSGTVVGFLAVMAWKSFDTSSQWAPPDTELSPAQPIAEPSALAPTQPPATETQATRALKQAKRAMNESRWEDALQAMQGAIAARDKTPYESVKTDEFLGFLLFKMNRRAEAIPPIERVVRSRALPLDATERYKKVLAWLTYNTQDFASSLRWAQEALSASPEDEELLNGAGFAGFRSGEFQGTVERMTVLLSRYEASGRAPDEKHIHLLASALDRLGKSEDSQASLRKWCPRVELPAPDGVCIATGTRAP